MSLTLWLVDRSRHDADLGHCARARYLGYHAGPHGYGWARQAQGMPAVTGNAVHSPLAGVLATVQATDALPDDVAVHHEIQKARAEYEAIVQSRGLTLTNDPAQLQLRVAEQTTLLEGLVWTWVRGVLPQMLDDWRVVSVETEDVTVLGCTCGLGDRIGTAEDHDARECRGLGWMTREDAIWQHRTTGVYSYHEFKTTGDANKGWEDQWAHRVQLVAGVLGAEQRLGATIDEVYVHGLVKGRFQSEWNAEERKASGPKYQNSPLCYGWRRPANPPLDLEDWQLTHGYVDVAGKNRKLGREYQRAGIWEMPYEFWHPEGTDTLSVSDYWVRALAPTGKLADCFKLVGPIYRDDARLRQFIRTVVAHEGRWQDTLWALHEAAERGETWVTEAGQALLDTLIPQSRGDACQSYFGDTCQFLGLCNQAPGWEDPALMGFIPRRPHHAPELDQMVSRGLALPDAALADGPEDERS